jgi:hypothetical protein
MKTVVKHENDQFVVITLKSVSSLMVIVNIHATPKLWHVDHENGHQTRKRRVFGQISQTYIEPYKQCKLPGAPKLWTIAHENDGKREN